MTAQEKAKELYERFLQFTPYEFEEEYAKKCALIAVDEILSLKMVFNMGRTIDQSEGQFYEQVKEEIEKL